MTTEQEDLQALVESDGWKLFAERVAHDWGSSEGNGARFLAGIASASKSADQDAMAQLRQIIVAQREIQILMRWPSERLAQLKRRELVEVGGQSRRGGL